MVAQLLPGERAPASCIAAFDLSEVVLGARRVGREDFAGAHARCAIALWAIFSRDRARAGGQGGGPRSPCSLPGPRTLLVVRPEARRPTCASSPRASPRSAMPRFSTAGLAHVAKSRARRGLRLGTFRRGRRSATRPPRGAEPAGGGSLWSAGRLVAAGAGGQPGRPSRRCAPPIVSAITRAPVRRGKPRRLAVARCAPAQGGRGRAGDWHRAAARRSARSLRRRGSFDERAARPVSPRAFLPHPLPLLRFLPGGRKRRRIRSQRAAARDRRLDDAPRPGGGYGFLRRRHAVLLSPGKSARRSIRSPAASSWPGTPRSPPSAIPRICRPRSWRHIAPRASTA